MIGVDVGCGSGGLVGWWPWVCVWGEAKLAERMVAFKEYIFKQKCNKKYQSRPKMTKFNNTHQNHQQIMKIYQLEA